MFRPLTPTCAPDCDHWEYKPRLKAREQQSDEAGLEGSEDGDLY
jgi:hypothetical protein